MDTSAQSEEALAPVVQLPRVTIKFCTQCKWMLRAAYVRCNLFGSSILCAPWICSSSIAQLFAMMHLSKSTIPFPLNSLYTLQPLRSALIARSGYPFKSRSDCLVFIVFYYWLWLCLERPFSFANPSQNCYFFYIVNSVRLEQEQNPPSNTLHPRILLCANPSPSSITIHLQTLLLREHISLAPSTTHPPPLEPPH